MNEMTADSPQASHTKRAFSEEEQRRYNMLRAQIAEELPDLVARSRLSDQAADEPTMSGSLRRAIHQSSFTLDELGQRAGIDGTWIDEFLTGERTLRSDVLDRLAIALGYVFPPHANLVADAGRGVVASQGTAAERVSSIHSAATPAEQSR